MCVASLETLMEHIRATQTRVGGFIPLFKQSAEPNTASRLHSVDILPFLEKLIA